MEAVGADLLLRKDLWLVGEDLGGRLEPGAFVVVDFGAAVEARVNVDFAVRVISLSSPVCVR